MNKIPMRAVCVGRMMVDLPKGSPLEWQQQLDYAKVSKLPADINTIQKFDATVADRHSQLNRHTKDNPEGVIKRFSQISNDEYVLQYADPSIPAKINTDPSVKTDRYLWLGNYGYVFNTGWLSLDEAASFLARIKDNFNKVVPISNYDPPAKAGFCIDSAMVVGKIGPIWSSPSANVPGWKGVSVDAGAREDDGSREPLPWQHGEHAPKLPDPFHILQMKQDWAKESAKSSDDDRVVSFDVLRKEEKSIAGLTGQETAIRIELANGQLYYRFDWNSTGDDSRPNKTGFSLDLEAGNYNYTPRYAPPPPKDDLLALWDAMLDSVTPRNGTH